MTIQLKNNAVGFLSASVSATATLLVLQSGEGANFPALVPSQFFYVTLASASGATEIVKVTGRSGDSLTVQRGQENTTAMSFPALSRVELRVTAQAVYDVIDAAISGTTTAVSNIASVIAVAASIDSVNTVTSNLASVINVSNNIGDINLVENSLTNVNIVAANMADINAVSDDLAAVNAVADDIDDLVTNLEDIVAVGGNISSVVTVANNVAGINALNSNIGVVTTVANDISGANNTGTVATNIAAVQTVSTNIASVNAVNSNSANVNTVAGSIANVNTTAGSIANVNTAATNIVAIQTAPAQATAAANSASAAATSATNAANSASAAAASAVTAVNAPGTSGTSTTSLTIGTGSQTITTQTGKAWVVGQFVTVASTASPTNFMHGQITAYNGGTGSMTVNVLAVGGSGTLASWTIGLVGPNATLTDQNSLQPVALTLPSIRPSLLLDFANAKKLDPRITFSRATSGTYYDGVTTALAEQNIVKFSQEFNNWTNINLPVTANNEVAPDGTTTADTFTATSNSQTLLYSPAPGIPVYNDTYTATIYVKAGTADYAVFSFWSGSGTNGINLWIDVQNGTTGSNSATSGYTFISASLTSAGSGWYRVTLIGTVPLATSSYLSMRIVDADGGFAYTTVAGKTLLVWGAQLEQRAAATAYVATGSDVVQNYVPQLLTAPAGVPRFDHNPTTGESLGLLVEEQRTNYFLRSSNFSTSWLGANGGTFVVAADTDVAPDGSLTADRIRFTGSWSGITQSATTAPGNTITVSIFAKYVPGSAHTHVQIQLSPTGGGNNYGLFDLTTGVFSQSGNVFGVFMLPVGNGWYRCILYATHSSTWPQNTGDIRIWFGSGATNTPSNSSAQTMIWGAQLEAGAFTTSYIPTTSASVTRTADDAMMTGANFFSWFDPANGSLYANIKPIALGGGNGVMVSDGTLNNNILLAAISTSEQARILSLGTIQTLDGGTPVAGAETKLAVAYATDDFALSLNGGSVATGTSGGLPVAVRQFQIGARTTTVGSLTIKKIAYYPARLTNAQLQALTA